MMRRISFLLVVISTLVIADLLQEVDDDLDLAEQVQNHNPPPTANEHIVLVSSSQTAQWRSNIGNGHFAVPKSIDMGNGDSPAVQTLVTVDTRSVMDLEDSIPTYLANPAISPEQKSEPRVVSKPAAAAEPGAQAPTPTSPLAARMPSSFCGPAVGSSSSSILDPDHPNSSSPSPGSGGGTPTTIDADDYAAALAQLSAFCDGGGAIPPYTHTAARVGGAVVYICARGHGEPCSGQNLSAAMSWLDATCGGQAAVSAPDGQDQTEEGMQGPYMYQKEYVAAVGTVPGWVYGDVVSPGSPASKMGRDVAGADFC